MLPSSSSSPSPPMSRRYESLEELLKQAGYKETRIFTPQRPPHAHSHSQNNKSETKPGSVRDVLKLFSNWVKKDDDGQRPTLRHASSVPHMRGRRAHQHHQQPPVPTWFMSLFSPVSQTAPSTPNSKRRARPLPRLLSNPRRPTRSNVSVTMTSVVCRPHSSKSSNKCPCRSAKRSDSTSTSSTSVTGLSLYTVSSRSSTQAEGSNSASSVFFGAKSTALPARRSRNSTGVPLLVPELHGPPRAGCLVCSCSIGGDVDDGIHQQQQQQCQARERGRGRARTPQCSPPRQRHLTDSFLDGPRRKFTYDNECRNDHDDIDDDDLFHDNNNYRRINYTTMDGDEQMTAKNADTDDDDEEEDDDDRIDLARILIPPRRQHSIRSLREVLHMDAKRITDVSPGKRLLRVNSRSTFNQNISPNVTPRKKPFLPPRFLEFRNDNGCIRVSDSNPTTPPSSPLIQQRQHARTPQPPRIHSNAEPHLQRGSGTTSYSQTSLPARMRNVSILQNDSVWEEPEPLQDGDDTARTPTASAKGREGLGIINLNTSSRRERGAPLNGEGANYAAHRGVPKKRGAITSLWNANPVR